MERIEASDTKHHSKITLTFEAQDNDKQVFIGKAIEIADV